MKADAESRSRRASAQRLKTRRKMEFLRNLKEAAPCADCGVQYPYYVMTFDHVPGRGPKLITFGHVQRGRISWSALREEIQKCDVVCANCQANRTFTRDPVLGPSSA